MINLYIIYVFILFTLSLNVWTFFQLRKKLTKTETLNYSYLLLTITAWAICNAGADISANADIALLFAQLSILFPLNIINALLRIVADFPKIIEKPIRSIIFKIGDIITFGFSIILIPFIRSSYNLDSFQKDNYGGANFLPGYLYYVLAVFAIILFLFIVFYWKRRFSLYTPIQKKQVLSLLITMILVFISMIFGLIIFPILDMSYYGPFMFLSLALLLFIINKSLWIKVVVVDIMEEIAKLSGLIVSAIALLVFWLVSGLSDSGLNIMGRFLISLILVASINFIYGKFQNIYNQRRAKSQSEVNHFIDLSTSLVQLDDIINEIKITLKELLQADEVAVSLLKDSSEMPIVKSLYSLPEDLKIPIINREILIESYFDKKENQKAVFEVYDYLNKNNIDMVIPVTNQKSLIALIYVRRTNGILNETDYNNMSLLSNGISVSINRSLLYEELQTFNKTLQTKVDEQTKELQIKVKELQEARRKESDMIDIMGHELRTPATVVKLNAQLLEKFIGDIETDPEGYKRYIGRIKVAIENEIKLINTLLSSAKLEGDKIELNPEDIDIINEIEMAIHGNELDAETKNLQIINDTENLPHVYADKARVVEILNNLLSNAIKYTDTGSIRIEGISDEKYVQISVIDSGKGIPKEDIPKLGQKFFRISNYIKSSEDDGVSVVRPGGTGLGLYVTFSLVQKMGGKIWVESEVGKGSKFIFTLPRYIEKGSPNIKNGSHDMFEKLGLRKKLAV